LKLQFNLNMHYNIRVMTSIIITFHSFFDVFSGSVYIHVFSLNRVIFLSLENRLLLRTQFSTQFSAPYFPQFLYVKTRSFPKQDILYTV